MYNYSSIYRTDNKSQASHEAMPVSESDIWYGSNTHVQEFHAVLWQTIYKQLFEWATSATNKA